MLKAIDTIYAGCKFRSRLEARWAVFLDALGVSWQYEVEGFECSRRLSHAGSGEKIFYLPDFWLPRYECHGEVKAALTAPELVRLLDVAACLSSNDEGGCGHIAGGHDVILFGQIPPRGMSWLRPTRLHMHEGDLQGSPWDPWREPGAWSCHHQSNRISDDCGELGDDPSGWRQGGNVNGNVRELSFWLTHGSIHESWRPDRRMENAYSAARQARFEHGNRDAG